MKAKVLKAITVGFMLIFSVNTVDAVPAKRILVVYFSMPETTSTKNMSEDESNSTVIVGERVLGNTQYFASIIQETVGGDIFRIEAANPYPINHAALLKRAQSEQDENARPALKNKIGNLEQYDVIFLGYPIWYYKLPTILNSFLEQHDLSGKTIIPFSTHGGSGFSGTVKVIEQLQPKATIDKNGLTISRDLIQNSQNNIVKWLEKLDVLKK